ncbi:carboxymuconolactone decarboxylase family protein [Nocardia sp. NPDC050710]|uniref:carboxymuconolactone decarboxylase family protein n=1 Tax=Nocardia sp. NPDC050710 TaxID=3157220 RepID=UPI0033D33FAF
MTRISGRSSGLAVKLAGFFTRRLFTRLTGHKSEAMTEPLEIYARAPGVMLAYGMVEMATARLHRVDKRLMYLAELKAATLTNCEYCIDLGSQVARHSGLRDDELLALPDYRSSPLFTDVEKLVLDYAVGISRTPVDVPAELFAELREHFDDTQLVELTHTIALENHRGRFNRALDVGAAGFSAGMVCAVPITRGQG